MLTALSRNGLPFFLFPPLAFPNDLNNPNLADFAMHLNALDFSPVI
ncbi:hypothetical protein [Hydrogenovibrio sp. JE_KL2]|nr:hypothetical protein [Hydrogenovibrio sp. JE_KL2]